MTQEYFLHSLDIINTALTVFGPDSTVCFNGGKDSTCMLALILMINRKFNYPLTCIFVEEEDSFDQIKDFVLEFASK
jgi:predicted phosphoadenosine phosphosulfate sulfurtransferase